MKIARVDEASTSFSQNIGLNKPARSPGLHSTVFTWAN